MTTNILNPRILHAAYSQGFFPMPDEKTGEILWYRPDPRAIIPLDHFHTSRSLRRVINKKIFQTHITLVSKCLFLSQLHQIKSAVWLLEYILNFKLMTFTATTEHICFDS